MDKNSVFSNLLWRFAERCGAQMVQFLVSIVLARLLLPEMFGKVALVLVISKIFQVFVDSGLGSALIQKKEADDLDFSSVFWFNMIWCFVLYGIIFLAAPVFAEFYDDVSLVPVIRVLCITVIISGLKNIQQAYVSRTMQFRKFFFATLGGTVVSAIVGVGLAYIGCGVWAIVAQTLVNLSVDTLVLWITVRWRPKFIFSFERLKGLLSYGWKLLASALLDTTYTNLYQLVIGKLYTSSDLAFFNQGAKFPEVITGNINSAIDSVLLPAMAQEQDDRVKVKAMTKRALTVGIFVIAPLMVGLACCSDTVVSLILTDKWSDCVPFMVIFCIGSMFQTVHTANLNAIRAMGRSDLFLKLEIIKKVFGAALILSTMWFGPTVIAWGILVEELAVQVVNSWPNRRLLQYSYVDQMKDILPSVILAAVMGVFVRLVGWISIPLVLKLILQVLAGGLFYIIAAILLHYEPFFYLWGIIKPKVFKNS